MKFIIALLLTLLIFELPAFGKDRLASTQLSVLQSSLPFITIGAGPLFGTAIVDTGSADTLLPPPVITELVNGGHAKLLKKELYQDAVGVHFVAAEYVLDALTIGDCVILNVTITSSQKGYPAVGSRVMNRVAPWSFQFDSRQLAFTCHEK